VRYVGLTLKIAVFATGCAGIVAEFVLSTLATYLSGNAVLQWTIVMSLMLFAMGLGSRLSKYFKSHLLDLFLVTELGLSLLCAASAILAYGLFGYTAHIHLFIYGLAMAIGILIGFEIPLVTRLNQDYEELRLNIASVMEKDYFGALVGGLFFAFVALPYLGLTYTPIVLGSINFLVAAVLLIMFFNLVERKKLIAGLFTLCFFGLLTLGLTARPIILYGEQRQYRDKIIFAEQTPYQKLVITRWKDNFWLYINGQTQFSTFDEERYHEPLVHPAMKLAARNNNILILGGGDGLGLREILKHKGVQKVTIVDLDPAMTKLAATHPILQQINQGSFGDTRVKVVNQDAAAFLKQDNSYYDVVIADLPDPDTIDLMHVYSLGFYRLIRKHLTRGGVMVTQASSPYFTRKAFICIQKTVRAAGFSVLPLHNQIATMGEWGWVLAVSDDLADEATLKRRALKTTFNDLPLKFLNQDALISMAHFGKDALTGAAEIRINTTVNPVLHRYYAAGRWDAY
jgi:spermidine synthase